MSMPRLAPTHHEGGGRAVVAPSFSLARSLHACGAHLASPDARVSIHRTYPSIYRQHNSS